MHWDGNYPDTYRRPIDGYYCPFADSYPVSFPNGYPVSFPDGYPYPFTYSYSYSAFDYWHRHASTQYHHLSRKRQ